MFLSVLCACLLGVVFSTTLLYTEGDDWETFKTTHNKKYTTAVEESVRHEVWRQNIAVIQKHNLEADMGRHTYWMGLNQFSDWSTGEYMKYLNGFRGLTGAFPNNTKMFINPGTTEAPPSVDWRTKGYVTPVKNQGQCGSCWAFSTTGTVEGQHFRKTGQLVSLSEQNLVDCAWPEGCLGCNGCWQRKAMEYIRTNPGIDTEQCYPYRAKNGNCHFNPNPSCIGATLTSWVAIRQYDENDLLAATASVGPIAIAIDAAHPSFQQYRTGVYYESKCNQKTLDHAVLIVGYGTENGQAYWLVKNSWGATWGENGYIKMARNRDNNCGIASYATYPIV